LGKYITNKSTGCSLLPGAFSFWGYMNLDKSKKRIAKKVKMGFQGYPEITLEYFGPNSHQASEVSVKYRAEELTDIQEERFSSKTDARDDEVIQSAIVKMIERSEAKTVSLIEGISVKKSP
jgi:hypothetical protein